MKASMRILCAFFNTNRMVAQYTENFYLPAAQRYHKLTENKASRTRQLVQWRSNIWKAWSKVRVEKVESAVAETVHVGSNLEVTTRVFLDEIPPEAVSVELYYGPLDPERHLRSGKTIKMRLAKDMGGGSYLYDCELPCDLSGLCGFAVRILPYHEDAILPFELPLITWEEDSTP
jgi:starch phosphorylase